METTDSIEFNIDKNLVCLQSNCRVQASVLRAMFDDDNLCDVSLYGKPASNTERNSVIRPIRTYKAVLAHASSHLYDLFTVDGFIDSHRSEYRIDDVDHESLRNIVTFIHTDKLKMNTANVIEQVCGILVGAKYLVMPRLADACESFLAAGDGQLKITDCVKLWCFARKYSCLELMHASSTLIAKHVSYMREDTEFLRMSYGDCSKLLMSEAVIAADAEARYNAAIKWLLYDADGRARHVRDILNMVPFTSGEISFDAVLQAEECDLLKSQAPDMVHQAMVSIVKRANGAQRAANFAVLSNAHVNSNSWYLVGKTESLKERYRDGFFKYDINQRSWSELWPLPFKLSGAGVCAIGRRLYLIGGFKNGNFSEDVDIYDTATETWSVAASKLSGRRHLLTACSDSRQHAYALGGSNRKTLNVVERYDIVGDTVETLPGMITGRHQFAVVFCSSNSNIFVAGGFAGERRCIDMVERYDICGGMWSKVCKMYLARAGLAAAIVNDDLYLAGGILDGESLNDVEVVNIRTGKIRSAPSLLNNRSFGHAATLPGGNVICVLGGHDDNNKCFRTVEAFDVREGKWSSNGVIVPDMPYGSYHLDMAAV